MLQTGDWQGVSGDAPNRPRGADYVWSWLGYGLDAAGVESVENRERWRLAGIGRHWPLGGWVGVVGGGCGAGVGAGRGAGGVRSCPVWRSSRVGRWRWG